MHHADLQRIWKARPGAGGFGGYKSIYPADTLSVHTALGSAKQ